MLSLTRDAMCYKSWIIFILLGQVIQFRVGQYRILYMYRIFVREYSNAHSFGCTVSKNFTFAQF